jgi:hypothetical protein
LKKKENVHPTKESRKELLLLSRPKRNELPFLTARVAPPFLFLFFRLWWWLKFFNIIISSSSLFYFFFSVPRQTHRYTGVLVVETVQSALVCRAVRSLCSHRFLKTKNLFLKEEEVGFLF